MVGEDVAMGAQACGTLDEPDSVYAAFELGSKGVTQDEAKRVLGRIDRRAMPLLFFIYMLQYLDKNGLNYASALGLVRATHMTSQNFSWLCESTSPCGHGCQSSSNLGSSLHILHRLSPQPVP